MHYRFIISVRKPNTSGGSAGILPVQWADTKFLAICALLKTLFCLYQHFGSLERVRTQRARAFIKKLEHVDLRNKKAFAFDTKRGHPLSGSAVKGIEKRLKRIGMNIVKPYASAIVKDLKGPLQDGMDKKFKQIGTELVS